MASGRRGVTLTGACWVPGFDRKLIPTLPGRRTAWYRGTWPVKHRTHGLFDRFGLDDGSLPTKSAVPVCGP